MKTKKTPTPTAAKATHKVETIEDHEVVEKAVEVQETVKKTTASFPIVGIGASAGGLAAFEAFFSGMPADVDPGMAFVLVQHLAPDHKSILTDLIRRYTRMQVFEVEDGMTVLPNCTYIIPPGRDMAFLNGTLQLLEPVSPRGQRLPIDFFFRSLAQDQRERAIGIILSGTGSDGTLGVRAIKGEGGMVMSQNPESTEYDGMPRSALATGLVDYELPPAEMASQLIAYAIHAYGKPPKPGTVPAPQVENATKKIFVLLRAQTGHDFSQYKPNTIHRRIERRMAVHQIDTLSNYVKYLQQAPPEVEALFRDLLIGVTNFFRDPEAFQTLEEQMVPKLFTGKPASATIRVWSPGCSTGEEAYSLAILLMEHMEALKKSYTVQLFATDIDSQAIATARAGIYSASIATDISPERLARFFTIEPDGRAYRIHKSIRDMLVFSEQNVIKDPPFSKLDLISCRNLLIYLNGDLQKRLIPLFHYALNPGGMLFLGTSETVGDFNNLFVALDRKFKLYQRKEDMYTPREARRDFLPPLASTEMTLPQNIKTSVPKKLTLRELTEQTIMQQVSLTAILVNRQGDIVYMHGRPTMYLELIVGETKINNILRMAREGLRRDLTTALHKAAKDQEIVCRSGLRIKTNGDYSLTNLTIRPVTVGLSATPEEPLYLVIFEETPQLGILNAEQPSVDNEQAPDNDTRVETLKKELRAKEEYLHTANEELETSNEELKSSNEEMQSVNEELQSTNEELETSKEELQSVNEELATVNSELSTKVVDLSQANNDMNNLLAGTGIATVFVDHQLRITRFTPAATHIINLILSDTGRPVAHTVTNLKNYDALVADTQRVLDTLIPKEVEVQTQTGEWYMLRIQPYRTTDNVIEGAVITFVNITAMKRAEASLQQANDLLRLAVVVRDAHDAIAMQDLEGRIMAWNPGAVRMYGWSEAEALTMNMRDLIPEDLREETLGAIHRLSLAEILEPYRTQRITKDGSVVEIWITATALLDESGQMYAIATTERVRGVERKEAQ
jgi:two-component system CheB/CheR fusion protein